MNQAIVNQSKLRSPLQEVQLLRPRRHRSAKKMVAVLILTSLVDAFSIMLLYLLVQGSGNGSTLELKNATRLPIATEATALHEGTLIRIEGGQYFVGQEPITEVALGARLQVERAKSPAGDEPALIVQADRDANFERLAAVVRAGSVSGYHNFKFAVLQQEDAK